MLNGIKESLVASSGSYGYDFVRFVNIVRAWCRHKSLFLIVVFDEAFAFLFRIAVSRTRLANLVQRDIW